MWATLWLSTSVVFFVMFPTLVGVCGDMIKCSHYVIGGNMAGEDTQTLSLLQVDFRIDCTSQEFKTTRNEATVMMFFWSLCIPLFFVWAVRRTMLQKGTWMTSRMWGFMLSG